MLANVFNHPFRGRNLARHFFLDEYFARLYVAAARLPDFVGPAAAFVLLANFTAAAAPAGHADILALHIPADFLGFLRIRHWAANLAAVVGATAAAAERAGDCLTG
jgi:hypothetical protein